MSDLRPDRCPITGTTAATLVFGYDAPPQGEIGFPRDLSQPYRREVWQFDASRHYVSRHVMRVRTDYDGDYVDATYAGPAGMPRAFDRVIGLPPEKSDNRGRIAAVSDFASEHFAIMDGRTLLDIGAGLGVFPYVAKEAGFAVTALDPDPRACAHIRERVGCATVAADFLTASDLGRHDVVTLNKVLEHVEDPIAMLARVRDVLAPGGFVYIEVPDGEVAARHGPEREEFYIEHLHVFSCASTGLMAAAAGFDPIRLVRLIEPSTKYTIRAFLKPVPAPE